MNGVKEELKENIRSLIKKYPTIFIAYTSWLGSFLFVASILCYQLTKRYFLAPDVVALIGLVSLMSLALYYVGRWEVKKEVRKKEKENEGLEK